MKSSAQILTLVCAALFAACASDTSGGPTGNTELNLDIVNPGGTSGELAFAVDRVDYRITCAGNAPGSYPIPDADTSGTDYNYNDSVDISGAFEVVDTRVPQVWQAVMDLPPGNCTVTLSVYEQDEIVCVGSQTLAINEDATTKYDIVLVCSLSIDAPDGMADIDGSFDFITGNLCPKLYVLNAIPSQVTETVNSSDRQTEIQYRAKDPDNSCGNNCDPRTCDFSNPPVCTPSPYNPNDPLCNPLAGGDPNSAACQSSGAGLVCTVAAWPGVSNPSGPGSGPPGGTFISPADGVTPVGPVLPVNLNTASGLPGVILPGLGGPAGTNAANSPAYPPLPNVNGSLPPLIYQCDAFQGGEVYITVSCSDGDADCDQGKQVTIECGWGGEFCITEPVLCIGSGECFTDGTCDPFCDPSEVPPCERCPGRDLPRAPGTLCSEGGGNVCDGAGACVECLDAQNTGFPLSNPSCDSTPADCTSPALCSGNVCQPRPTAPDGTPCSNGVCSAGACVFDPVDPCQDTPFSECQGYITVMCGNSITADVSILGYWLISDPDPIIANQPFDVFLSGVATFDQSFLDAAQGAIPGGVTNALVVDARATVQTRGDGATGPNVTLEADLPSYECRLDDTGPGAQQVCNPNNDLASIPGLRGNTDCVPTGSFNPCGRIVELPISYDCVPGGECDALGKSSQCAANGFCVNDDLFLQLNYTTSTYTAGDGVSPGQTTALFGWYDNPADATQFVGTPAIDPDGTFNVQQPVYTGISGPIGFAVNAGGLAIQLDCVQGVFEGDLGAGFPQDASPTPDSLLRAFPVQVP